eukprot:651165-Pyramimonas_sp.AAC.1
MMCAAEYALTRQAYRPPPGTGEDKQFKQMVEESTLRFAELLAQGKKAGPYMGALEHELIVLKCMHWQLKQFAIQRTEAKFGMMRAEE